MLSKSYPHRPVDSGGFVGRPPDMHLLDADIRKGEGLRHNYLATLHPEKTIVTGWNQHFVDLFFFPDGNHFLGKCLR